MPHKGASQNGTPAIAGLAYVHDLQAIAIASAIGPNKEHMRLVLISCHLLLWLMAINRRPIIPNAIIGLFQKSPAVTREAKKSIDRYRSINESFFMPFIRTKLTLSRLLLL